ncbi:methylmalonyl-CoA carboxyltransferase [Rhodococcus sp. SC4]|jgi:acetyl-CoA carboxylase carboxyltransferase component|uniref:acyl-CoA carboxylase subunit beta n=1 Tax=unclassified Rhodococcus (in: high G+C Gram-positive bacteria) TaxID=192944 RepID=UPI00076AC8B5|nr:MULTISPECIES: acyl-CoA carboxylase subunit beta [unclassified Rhodococcus (in: high G+C Gram-positive bacteria)]KXF48609.1 methylmalonyl-CoA carboxyltransferase [Rhodococcus sp. SC4]KXX55647.1 methylmalonyl-CoA carboxyltransferase [Rhodococcus sp. LB1]PBC59378.1 methylmalonyl-CoA carboxyltransferase [Rhodococcus sp. ACPA1]
MTRTTAELLADLEVRLEQSLNPGSPRAIARRAEKGLPGPRERIRMLLDRGSFIEVGQMARNPGAPDNPYGDGVVTGHGTVDGRPVAVFSHDHTVFGGSVGEMFGRKVASIMEFAARIGCPCVGINDSGGARVQDAVTSLAWYAEMGRRQIPLSGVCPQVSILLGKCAGGAAYAPINTDLVVAVDEQAYMFVTGPGVIKSVTGEDVTLDELGGARAQAENGNVHHVAPSEEAAFAWVREYLGFLPSSRHEEAPIVNPGLEPDITDNDLALNEFMPDADNAAYDMQDLLLNIFDDGDFHELAAQTAPNVITGFSRVDGRSVGVVANQPQFLSGALDQVSADKAARFVRICDAYEIPLVFVVDTPGFLPGLEQERNGVLRSGGRFLQAFAAATVPKVTVVVRKSYGGGYAVMGCKQLGADVNFAWPTARIAVMGAEAAISLLYHRELEAAGDEQDAMRQQLVDAYNENVATPYSAAERGYIDAVIEPSATRLEIRRALTLLRDKHSARGEQKHHLIPL